MKSKLLILGVLLAQIAVAQELKFVFPPDSLRFSKIMAYEDNYSGSAEYIVDTVDVFATVIDWEAQTVHQTFLKEVRRGHMEMQQVFKKIKGANSTMCCAWEEVPVWTDRKYYYDISPSWSKYPTLLSVQGQVTNVIYKPVED